MWKAAHSEDIDENKLNDYIDDWGLHGGFISFDAWIIWRRSNYTTLPFEGGWFDQAWWIREDFLTLDLVRQWHDMNSKKVDTTHIPNPFEQFGA